MHIERAVIIGPSMGGGIALAFAIKHLSYVSGLILIAPAGLTDSEILSNIEKLSIPTLIFWGERDRVFPLKTSNKIVQKIPHAKLVICPKARHPCYLDTPDLFHKHIIDFLSSL